MRRVESLEELNRICQKPDYRTVGNRMVRYFERPAALYVSWLLLHAPVTANQVTVAAWAAAVLGGFCLARGSPGWFFAGMALMQFWYLLDHVDGQIARYRKTESLDGLYFDFMMHHGVSFILPFAAGLAVYARGSDIAAVVMGAVAAASIVMAGLLNDCRTKAYYHALVREGGAFRVESGGRGSAQAFRERASEKTAADAGFVKRIFSLAHKACEGHVVMNLWSLYAVVYLVRRDAWVGPVDSMRALVFAYAVVSTAVWIARLAVFVRNRSVSGEFERTFVRSGAPR